MFVALLFLLIFYKMIRDNIGVHEGRMWSSWLKSVFIDWRGILNSMYLFFFICLKITEIFSDSFVFQILYISSPPPPLPPNRWFSSGKFFTLVRMFHQVSWGSFLCRAEPFVLTSLFLSRYSIRYLLYFECRKYNAAQLRRTDLRAFDEWRRPFVERGR